MKTHLLYKLILSLGVLCEPTAVGAWQDTPLKNLNWAMATMEKGQEKPIILEYRSVQEKAANGVEYHRIYDYSYWLHPAPYNPVKLPYGFRMSDKRIYLYDFEKNTEYVGFDFTLTMGDRFTTCNGVTWQVEAARDTLMDMRPGYMQHIPAAPILKRLLDVRSVDGRHTDQWLEDFGSFTNFFMLQPLDELLFAHALWMEYHEGSYVARDILADPFFAHDSGWLDGLYNEEHQDNFTYASCRYENNQVVFENAQLEWPHRDYACFYRKGDDIHRIKLWELAPHVDSGTEQWIKEKVTFTGLPAPQSGQYTVHIGEQSYTTNLRETRANASPTAHETYDLQGRKWGTTPPRGIYIRERRKVRVR